MPESQRPNRIHAIAHVFMVITVFMVCFFVFNLIGMALAAAMSGMSLADIADPEMQSQLLHSTAAVRVLTIVGSGLTMLASAWIVTKVIRADSLSFLNADKLPKLKWLFLSLLFFVLLIPSMELLLQWNLQLDVSGLSQQLNDWIHRSDQSSNETYGVLVGQNTRLDLLVNLLLMGLIPALAEEWLFRGAILNILHGLFKNIHLAIIVSALSFALLHMQLLKLLPMFLMALTFGYMVYWTGSVWTAVTAHFLNNAIAVFALHNNSSGDYSDMMNQGLTTPWWLSLITFSVAGIIFWYFQHYAKPKLQCYYE